MFQFEAEFDLPPFIRPLATAQMHSVASTHGTWWARHRLFFAESQRPQKDRKEAGKLSACASKLPIKCRIETKSSVL